MEIDECFHKLVDDPKWKLFLTDATVYSPTLDDIDKVDSLNVVLR